VLEVERCRSELLVNKTIFELDRLVFIGMCIDKEMSLGKDLDCPKSFLIIFCGLVYWQGLVNVPLVQVSSKNLILPT